MAKKAVGGNYIEGGERVTITSPLSGNEWTGTVLRWLHGAPELLADTGEKRWFPAHWPREEAK
jgi:hypothetical protein